MYPERTRNLWLATSASAGASRSVGIKSCDQRCMNAVLSIWYLAISKSCDRVNSYCNKRSAASRELLAPGFWFLALDFRLLTPLPPFLRVSKVLVFPCDYAVTFLFSDQCHPC